MPSIRRRRRHSHKLIALAIVVMVLAALGGSTTLAYAAVKTGAEQLQAQLTIDLHAGQTELEAGKVSLTQANKDHDAYWATRAGEHFAAARTHFQAASQLADGSTLLHNLERLPSFGDMARSRHTAVGGIAAMGVAVADAGQDLATLDAELIKPATSGTAGRTLLTLLNQTRTGLIKVRAAFDRADKAAAQVDVRVVPTGQQVAFLKARDTIGTAIAGLDEFDRLFPVLTEVLGGNGTKIVLVEQVNPAELRAGGGFIGTYSLIRADQGILTVIRSGDAYELVNPRPLPWQTGFIPQPTPYREIIPGISWSFVDSNIFPDFPSNAMAAKTFVEPRLGMKIDAVISMDYYTVRKMLELTGALPVPGYGLTVDSQNFIDLVMKFDLAGSPEHKAILGAISGKLMDRVSALPSDRWPAMIAALNEMAVERHLQAYFFNPTVQAEIDRVGWSGTFNPNGARDFMMEVESNYWGTKSNYFLWRRYTIELSRKGTTLHHHVIVDMGNNEPCGLELRTMYKANIRLYIGTNASAASDNLTRVRYANPSAPTGFDMFDGWLYVNCSGGTGRAVFDYDTPWMAGDRGSQRIYWQKQPGTVSDVVDVSWNDGVGGLFRAHAELAQDLIIILSPTGVAITAGHSAQATLPSLGIG